MPGSFRRRAALGFVLVLIVGCARAVPLPTRPDAARLLGRSDAASTPRHVQQLIGFGGAVFDLPKGDSGTTYGHFPLTPPPVASATAPVEPRIHYRLNPIY